MIGHDQASGAGPHGFLDEPIEIAPQGVIIACEFAV
jgi:hypothetical protein